VGDKVELTTDRSWHLAAAGCRKKESPALTL